MSSRFATPHEEPSLATAAPLEAGAFGAGVSRAYLDLAWPFLALAAIGVAVNALGGSAGLDVLRAVASEGERPAELPLLFVAVAASGVAIGAPRLAFCAVAGMLFGFGAGLLLVQGACLVGAFATFVVSRGVARERTERLLERRLGVRAAARAPSVLEIFLARQLPVASVLVTLYLGTTRATHGRFLLGSFLGFLPAAAVFTLLGSGLMTESLALVLLRIWGAAVLLALAAWASVRLSRRRATRPGTPLGLRPGA